MEPFLQGSVDANCEDLSTIIEIEEQQECIERELDRHEAIEVSIFKASNEELIKRLEEESSNRGISKAIVQFEMKISSAVGMFDAMVADVDKEATDAIEKAPHQ